MEPDALQALEDEADAVLADRIAASSRYSYRNSNVRFLTWMIQHKRHLVQDAFAASLTLGVDGLPTRESLLSALAPAPANPPLFFNRLTARDFIAWVLSMKTEEGKYFTFSTYSTHRSALGSLLRDYDNTVSAQVSKDLANRFSGLKKRVARQTGAGQSQIKVGKDPLQFNFFKRLASSMLIGASRDLIFARTFMLMSWNLMSRAANTTSICYQHLEWGEDALRVYFAHMKNDQSGSRPRDPRHIYANPLNPEICPILSLGIYWATHGIDVTNGYLFPGSNQYDRFRKLLGRVLGQANMEEELIRRGVDADSIGTHSMRKGAATFCSSGTTACPSAIAVHLRAGWAMGGVSDRYLRHDGAGDMHVGRTVCGLPSDKAEFATLPPQFKPGRDEVTAAQRLCFQGLPAIANGVGEFALASLIYHFDYLRNQLPSQHPLFQNPLMRNSVMIDQLRRKIARTLL